MGEEEIQKREREKMEGKLESMKKKNSLEQENLKGRLYYKSPKEKIVSYMFEHLIQNFKSYNGVKI